MYLYICAEMYTVNQGFGTCATKGAPILLRYFSSLSLIIYVSIESGVVEVFVVVVVVVVIC